MSSSETEARLEKKSKLLWSPPGERVRDALLTRFMRQAASRHGRTLESYDALHEWSVTEIGEFWDAVREFCGVVSSGTASAPLADASMPRARWFEGLELSFAENLLRAAEARPNATAIIFEAEDEAQRREITFAELRDLVARSAAGLERLGVEAGDRVAALIPNIPEAVIAMLAATSLGAIWSSCSPDFGAQGVFDRFGQIEPKVLFAANGYVYAGKPFAMRERLADVLKRIPSIEHTVICPYRGPDVSGLRGQVAWDDLLGPSRADGALEWTRRPWAHPLAILYTSGTTGVPKCIVHGTGGVLLKHVEEHQLQCDVKPDDVMFYFTTCGWMMWNWLVSGLASGAAIVLYDGNPLFPDAGRLFRLVDRNGITIFGTSPRFLAAVEKSGMRPRDEHSLGSLGTMLSTGAPLHPSQFEFVYDAIKPDIWLASISGGTDLIGCFVLGSPLHSVHAGEIQCKALGMKVEAFDDAGHSLVGKKGELVCTAPFPSMPIGFWSDPDDERYRKAYFERFPGVWHHGDWIEFTTRGSAIIHGRSDATLNPGGVRIGTAEIYRIVEQFPEINDALAVGVEEDCDVRILLFVVLSKGSEVSDELRDGLRKAIRRDASPRHVPAEVHAVSQIPRTISGKSVELAVAGILRGEEALNRDALANPQALDEFKRFARAPAKPEKL